MDAKIINDEQTVAETLEARRFTMGSLDEILERTLDARGGESQYRKGYQNGMIAAARYVRELYKIGGFVRPSEIANILETFALYELDKWRKQTHCEEPLKQYGEPRLKQESWAAIRKVVFDRDGNECQHCGQSDQLEVHHILPVSEGGIPEIDNLKTLCFDCHRLADSRNSKKVV